MKALAPTLTAMFACTPMQPASFNAMTFNIRYLNDIDGPDGWEFRRDFVLDVIYAQSPDLIGFQEAMEDQVADLVNGLPGYAFVGVQTRRGDGGQGSLLAFKRTRYRLVAERHYWISPTPNVPFSTFDAPGFNPARTMSCAQLEDRVNGTRMYFCNVHLTGGVVADPAAQVLAQILRDDLADYPVVLVGDFNAFPLLYDEYPTSPEWLARGRSRAYDTLTSTLVDAHKVLHPHNQRASYCGWEASCEDYDIGDLRLDWILHSPVFTPVSAKILVRRRDGRNVSDHWPVEAVVTITPSNSP